MSNDSDRADLAQRLESIRATAGLPAFADAPAVLDAMIKAGTSIWFHGIDPDASIADRLHSLRSRQPGLFAGNPQNVPALNGPGPRLDEDFRKFLGGLAAEFHTLAPEKRLALFDKFKAEQAKSGEPSEGERLRKDLTIRYGDVAKAPAPDRARLADAEGQRAGPAAPIRPNAAQVSALTALHPAVRPAAHAAMTESTAIRREMEQLRASHGGGFNVERGRSQRIERLEQRLATLRQRFPAVVAA